MKPQRNPFIIIAIAFGVIFIIAIVITIIVNDRQKKATTGPGSVSYNVNHQTPEKGGPAMVNIQGTEQLNNILLSQQYETVISELNTYILSHVGSKTASAQVTNTVVNNDGSVTFTVTTSKPSSTFTVNIDRSQQTTLVFSVPSTGFQQTLQPYASGADSD